MKREDYISFKAEIDLMTDDDQLFRLMVSISTCKRLRRKEHKLLNLIRIRRYVLAKKRWREEKINRFQQLYGMSPNSKITFMGTPPDQFFFEHYANGQKASGCTTR
jgi:hypothetical protein